ncbi:hypothetical protein JYG23_11350 [Sedimentibacter sp. zth1]|uniref:hypothetical protein n=1 Tax=Sedimentibacter sp. zth1 TaxID=2816908 RepID=UPI001A91FCB5|nr:hypothetical protein [Sedimentibacter sp. zth1]QSX05267.1 hypothetical protein JYG23_11350 [Sedimentibacter sp. zth1]
MKKFFKWYYIVAFIILIFLTYVFCTQFNNIKALLLTTKFSKHGIEEKIVENDKVLEEYLEKYSQENAEKNILDNRGTSNEIAIIPNSSSKKIVEEKPGVPIDSSSNKTNKNQKSNANKIEQNTNITSDDKNSSNTNLTNSKESVESEVALENDDNNKADEIINNYVVQMYLVKKQFVNSLSELEEKIYKEYIELPKEDRDFEHKKSIVLKNYNYVSKLEKQCDKTVNEIVNNLEEELEEIKADTEIVDAIKKVYENEKALKKAYYISLLKGE